MRKLTITLAAAAAVLGSTALTASAQTHLFGAALKAQMQNATPVVKEAACQGWGPYCGPGYVRACGPYRCWCRPCY